MCRDGQISDNRIYRAKMGGYLLETCQRIVGCGNVILENGSRGVTLERGSIDCIFSNNVISHSGREGLWAPDCIGLVVTSNLFRLNGRKPHGPERRFIWNANITINEAHVDPTNSPTKDYLINNNLITSDASQIAAMRIDASSVLQNIVIRGNMLLGDNKTILIEGANQEAIFLHDNIGHESQER